MPLTPNQTLLHYKIIEQIGEGGMGVVWRATDTTLQRDVAIKVLPDNLANSPERLARFEREAKVLASLNHPNIAAIHGLHEADGTHFLVLELIEGEDLAARMNRGAIPIDEAVTLAIQIATALEAAHENQVVHRDLKPANVKLAGGKPGSLSPGTVKVLDFGLAKVWAPDSTDASLSFSPTITANMTQAGVILGTAAYMSPEQARGQEVDKRSDVWSFGVLLYEMLTGARLFAGDTATDILGAIVHRKPDWDALPENTPPALVRLLKRCLTQELSERLRDIGEARYALTHLKEDDTPLPAAAAAPAAKPATTWPWKAAAGVFLVLSAILIALIASSTTPREVLQVTVEPPPGHRLLPTTDRGGQARVSPDGRALTFVAEEEAGAARVWVRPLDSTEARPVPGTEGGTRPFWSPDGRSIAFFAEGKIRRAALDGGGVLAVADARDGRGGDWSPEGVLVFSPGPGMEIQRVPAGGGQVVQITTFEDSEEARESSHREPRLLPDGRHFLYLAQSSDTPDWKVRVGSIEGGLDHLVTTTSGGAFYSEGYLLTMRGTTLVAQEFDTDTFVLSGEPMPVAENVILEPNFGIGGFSAGPGGLLAYHSGRDVGTRLTWISAEGQQLETIGTADNYVQFTLSPDRTRVAASIQEADGIRDLWIIDLERGARTRFTFTSREDKAEHGEPLWSPDGKWIAYQSNAGGTRKIYRKPADGMGDEELFRDDGDTDLWPYDWSPDGKYIVYGQEMEEQDNAEDLVAFPVSGDGEPIRITNSNSSVWPGSFSPDGRWVAYASPESGRSEVYVVPFPALDGRWQVSTNGGHYPRWGPDGSRLYFWHNNHTLMEASVKASGSTVQVGTAREILTIAGRAGWHAYGIAEDEEKFLVLAADESLVHAPISLFFNWQEELKRR